eukprot:g36669.t1
MGKVQRLNGSGDFPVCWTTVKAVVEVPKEEINKFLAALEALHKNRSQADEALIAATEHIATQLHRKIHGNDDNII